jgi:hypothetical protein
VAREPAQEEEAACLDLLDFLVVTARTDCGNCGGCAVLEGKGYHLSKSIRDMEGAWIGVIRTGYLAAGPRWDRNGLWGLGT